MDVVAFGIVRGRYMALRSPDDTWIDSAGRLGGHCVL